jgi:hypothetical protein
MAVSLKHAFQSASSDGPDATKVQPSNWNAEHTLTCATASLLGRTTAGTGAVEELSAGTGISLSAGTVAVDTATVATLTGTQNLTNKTLTTGNTLNAGTAISDTGTISPSSPGFRGLPIVSPAGAYTLGLTDAGKIIYAVGNITVPANSSIAFPSGTTIVVVNVTPGSTNITISSSDFIYLAAGTAGTRTLVPFGIATLLKVNSNSWIASGPGLT